MAVHVIGGACAALKVVTTALTSLDCILDVIEKVRDQNERLQHILGQIKQIKTTLDLAYSLELSEAAIKGIQNVEERLASCGRYVNGLLDVCLPLPDDFLFARRYSKNLDKLETDLDRAVNQLNLAFTVQNTAHLQGRFTSRLPSVEETGPIPGRPVDLKAPKRAHDRLLLTWQRPTENSEAMSSYKVQYRRRGKQWGEILSVDSDSESVNYVLNDLDSDTYYWFRVRAVNARGYPGRFSACVLSETKYNPHVRRFLAAGAGIGTTLTAPLAMLGISGLKLAIPKSATTSTANEDTATAKRIALRVANVDPLPMSIGHSVGGIVAAGPPVFGFRVGRAINSVLDDDEF